MQCQPDLSMPWLSALLLLFACDALIILSSRSCWWPSRALHTLHATFSGLSWSLLMSLWLARSDDDVVSELLVSMQAPTIDGLSACGQDTPFTAIFERQERCMAEAQSAGMCMLIHPASYEVDHVRSR